jgi:CubicO group peptidase (beta-lactamase class C family)
VNAASGLAPALELYPELSALQTLGREAITIEHLMTMSSGLDWKEMGYYGTALNDENGLDGAVSVAEYLFNRKLVAPPGTRFNYCGAATAVLAELLTRLTGQSLIDFARTQLFAPLGITHWEWRKDGRGRALAHSGLRLRPRDMVKLGRMVLSKGEYEKSAIVPSEWVAAATRPRITTSEDVSEALGPEYGYQWWAGKLEALGTTHRWVGGIGNGGQRLYLVPTLDLIVVMTAGEYNGGTSAVPERDILFSIAANIRS